MNELSSSQTVFFKNPKFLARYIYTGNREAENPRKSEKIIYQGKLIKQNTGIAIFIANKIKRNSLC